MICSAEFDGEAKVTHIQQKGKSLKLTAKISGWLTKPSKVEWYTDGEFNIAQGINESLWFLHLILFVNLKKFIWLKLFWLSSRFFLKMAQK